MWRNCASSTCSFPSKLRARWANISRIRPLRSSTRHCRPCSRLRSWLGLSEALEMTSSALLSATLRLRSSTLPLPMKKRESGRIRVLVSSPTIMAPAELASSLNSSRSLDSGARPGLACSRIARSPLCGRSNNSTHRFLVVDAWQRPGQCLLTRRARAIRHPVMANECCARVRWSKSRACTPSG